MLLRFLAALMVIVHVRFLLLGPRPAYARPPTVCVFLLSEPVRVPDVYLLALLFIHANRNLVLSSTRAHCCTREGRLLVA